MDNGCLANIIVTLAIWHVQDVIDISLKSMETLFILNTDYKPDHIVSVCLKKILKSTGLNKSTSNKS